MNGHVHACPKCYRRIPCTYPGCDHTEPDLTLDDGTLCGPHQVCDGCEDAALAARGGIHHCQPNSLAWVQLDSDGQTGEAPPPASPEQGPAARLALAGELAGPLPLAERQVLAARLLHGPSPVREPADGR